MTSSIAAQRTRTHAAAHMLKHAAEHDRGECPNECTSTADEFRAEAVLIDRAAARRFAALDERSRQAYAYAARVLAETEQPADPDEDPAMRYARKYGLVSAALEALLDLVGLAPEE